MNLSCDQTIARRARLAIAAKIVAKIERMLLFEPSESLGVLGVVASLAATLVLLPLLDSSDLVTSISFINSVRLEFFLLVL